MDNLNDLKAIWLTAKTNTLPDSAEMVQHIKKYRRQKLSKLIGLIALAFLSVAIMGFILLEYRSAMITTRIAEILILVAALILAATNLNSLNRFYKLTACSNKEFIRFLEHTRVRRLFYYKRTQVAVLSCCLAAMSLSLYGAVYSHDRFFIIFYIAIIIYILVMGIFVRPKLFKKQSAKLNATIEKIEKISKQL